MNRRADNQKLAAMALGATQHVVQAPNLKVVAKLCDQGSKVHTLVEMATGAVGAIEMQAIPAWQATKCFVGIVCHARNWHANLAGTRAPFVLILC